MLNHLLNISRVPTLDIFEKSDIFPCGSSLPMKVMHSQVYRTNELELFSLCSLFLYFLKIMCCCCCCCCLCCCCKVWTTKCPWTFAFGIFTATGFFILKAVPLCRIWIPMPIQVCDHYYGILTQRCQILFYLGLNLRTIVRTASAL